MAATEGRKVTKFGGKQPACRASRPGDHGRCLLRRLQPRPLRDRRLVLPDDARWASWSPGPWTRRCGRSRSPATRAGRHPARRRHLAMRPDRQRGIVVDFSKHLNRIISLDVENRTCVVEPGIVLDDLNRQLKKHGLWFPVDVSTASRATIGGMAGNNSCGGRSLRYGTMRDNTLSMDAALADGTLLHFGEVPRDLARANSTQAGSPCSATCSISASARPPRSPERFPKVQRRVGGYNLDALVPRNAPNNMAHLLVGSEGTLAFTTQVELKLWPVIRNKVLGVCHFGSFYEAMDAAQHLVKLRPIAVELVDRTMIALGRDIAMFQPDHRDRRARRSRRGADRRIRRGGSGRKPAAAEAARRTDGRSRLWLGQPAAQMGRRGRDHRARAADRHRRFPRRRPQRHDVDEAGGQAGLLRRGLRGAAAASRRLHRAAQRASSPGTAPAAPCMRTPPKAACMCARCST